MKTFYLFIRSIFTPAQARRLACLALGSLMTLLLPGSVFGQTPSISYAGPQTYTAGVAITPLSPTSSNVSGFGYSTPVQVGHGFDDVVAMASDASGNIYVVDDFPVVASNGNISYASLVKEISAFDGSVTSLYSDSFGIRDFAVDPGGNMYLIDHATQITEIPHGGSASSSFQIGSGFNNPMGVAADGAGNVYVADYQNFAIKRVNAGSGAVVTLWTGDAPNSVAVDAGGDVFFSILSTGDVYEIPHGSSAATRVTGGATRVATDAGGNLVIITQNSVLFVPSGGTTATTIAGGLGNVTTATVDPSGNVWMGALLTNDSLGVKKMKPVGGYYVSPQLPLGLSLDNNTGTISGTPLSGAAAKDYTVTAFSSTGKATATVNITVNNSTDATLSDLELSSGTLTPAFASGTTSYTATVGSGVSSITVTPSSSHNASSINVNGATVASGTASGNVTLQPGNNTITIWVTAQDGTTQKAYTVVVTRPSTDASLSGLTPSSGSLTPAFSAATFSYNVTVPNTVSSLTVTPATASTAAAVTVNGSSVADLTASQSISLNVGSNTITVVVTAQDGVTKNTYTVTVTRLIPLPSISYSSPQTYPVNVAVSTLTPTSSNVAAWSYDSTPSSLGSTTEPLDVATDATGNVYVADIAAGHVIEIPAAGGSPVFWGSFSAPLGVAVDASGNVYVANGSSTSIIEVSGGSRTTTLLGSGFSSPSAVAVDAAGNVYVADSGNGALKEIPAGNGTPVTIKSGFGSIQGVAVDASGNLFVADEGTSGNGVVYKIPAGGGSMVSIGSGFSKPSGVTVDAAGNLYVSDLSKSVITAIAPDNTQFTLGSGFNTPNGVAVDGSGNVYVADSNNGAVKKAGITGGYFLSKLLPAGLTFNNSTGTISGTPTAVSSASNYTVTAYNAVGSTSATVNITVNAPPPPAISYSTPLTFVQGTAITAQSPTNTGSAAGTFGFGSPNLVTTGVTDPVCMTMDKSGNMYIGESSGKVSLLAAGGSSATVFASGFGPVNSIVLDPSNNVYLADGAKVWKIPAGGGTAVSLSSYSNPVGVALDAAGYVYVADDNIPDSFGTVFRMAPDGSGEFGFVIAENPKAVVFDANGAEYDLEGTSPAGELLQEVAGGSNSDVAFAPNESYLAVDGAGNIFEGGSGGINYYSSIMGGTFNISNVSTKGIMFDANNNLYYADGSNIYKMSPKGGYTISPSLPSGLAFNSNTGVISGTPVSTSPATNYTITAFTTWGSGTATINITVDPHLPVISYSSPQSYQVGTAVALAPSSTYVSSWGYSSNITAIGTFFHALTDVVTDAAGNKYVSEFGNGQLDKIPAGGGAPVVVASGFSGPFGLAIDAGGNLYITDSGNNAVREIPAGTSTVTTIGSGFNAPAALAVDASGNVYVGDTGNGALKEIPAGNGTPVTLQTGFASIQGVAVDAAGNVYVADAGTGSNGALYKVPPGGGSMVSMGTGFSRPSGIVVDAAGNLYVSDLNHTFVTIIKPDGTQLSIASGVVRVNGVALDASGNLYMADTGTGFVEEVKINGGYFLSPLLPAGLTFNNGTGVISGTPAVSSPTANYTVTGWNITGSTAAALNITVGAPVISYTTPVAYATGAAITPLTPTVSGGAVAALGFNSAAVTQLPGISDAVSLTMDKSGNIYIGQGQGNISVLPAGASASTVFATGFAAAWSIALDASNNVFLADGQHVWKIPAGGGTAISLGSFISPVGLAFDAAGNIYVADNSGATGGVFKMNSDGTGQTRIDNNLPQPAYIAFDDNGNLYIGDQTAQALYEIPAGGVQKQVASGLGVIVSVKTDPSGNVYILGRAPDGLYCYSPVSGLININHLYLNGLMTDANFNLYYAAGNVYKISPSGGYFTSPQLPAGLNIDPGTGAISGTPAAASPTTNYTVKAFNSAAAASANINITVGPAPAISYSTPQIFTVGTAVSPLLPASTGAAVSAPAFNTPVAVSTGITDASCTAMDKNGNLYIGELSGKVSVLASGSTIATVLATGFTTYSSTTQKEGIAVDASGNVYFADGIWLWKIPAGGGTPVKLDSDNPSQLAIDAAGNLYFSSFAQGVYKITTNGTNKTKIVSTPATSMAIDQNGNVFFSSRGSLNKLLEVPVGGTQITINPNQVKACATDPSGNAYMVNADLSITVVPAGGAAATQVEPAITGLTSIMIGSDLNLYAVVNGGIVKTNFSGGYFISPELPLGLNIDPTTGAISGTPTVASPAANYTVTGVSGSVGSSAIVNLTINPLAPTISYTTPQVYVQNTSISPLSPVSTDVATPGYLSTTTVAGSFAQPFATAVDAGGNIYVADKTANGIYELPAAGGQVTVGTGLNTPAAVAVDKAGNVYAACQGDNTVVEIHAHSSTQTFVGSGYQRPTALAVDSAGNVYVADVQGAAGIVYKIRPGRSKQLFKSGFISPNGIAVDAAGNVYVSDFGGGPTASMVYKISPDGSTITPVNHSFTTATGLAIDATGNLFMVDGGNLSILEYPAGGGSAITITAGLSFPFGLSADGTGNLYVADPGANKVVKLTPAGGYFINKALPAGLGFNTATGVISGTPAINSAATNYTVTAYNITGSGQGAVNIAVQPDNARLASMGPQFGPLSPVFYTGTTNYTISLPNSKASMTVTPVTVDPNATMTVNGVALASGHTSAPVTLAEGATTTISVKVTASDGVTTQTYTVHATRAPSANADLSWMGPGKGPLTPLFNTNVTSYTETVNNLTTGFSVSPVSVDPNATITVNGSPVTSGGTSDPIPLAVNVPTNVNVVVTAQDGTTTKTYTIVVTRPKSGNATLSSMGPRYGPLSPVFAPGTNNYSITIANDKPSVTVTPVAAEPNATITVNGKPVTSGSTSAPVTVPEGQTANITVVVTAQDGTINTYTVAVTRAPSPDADLSSMGPQYGPLSPTFISGTTSYTLSLPNTKPTMTVTPVTADPNATIMVNGTAVTSGSKCDPVPLTAGSATTITVVVTAQDGTTTKTYTIAVDRAPGATDSFQDVSASKPAETVTLADDGIKVHQGISPNGDGIDDFLQIDNISQYPDNHLSIINRNGQLIFEAKGYDNTSKTFDGHSSKNGKMQLPGTYFFQLDYTVSGILKHKTGFIVLKY